MDKKKYPIGCENYVLYEVVGQGVSASVYRALCIPFNETVAVKILDFERYGTDLSNISREAQTMILVEHPNVLKAYCSFVSDHDLWVVMPFMAGGSFLHILKAAYPNGLEEVVIATILREVLKGLEYLHQHGHIHRDVKAGNILVDARGAIKLGDFGVSACLFDSGDRQRTRNTFVGTPCWMAPEVMEQLHGYDFKADIWSFGITALELAHGHAPFSKYPPMKVLLMTLQNAPPGLDYERDKKFSKSFKQMIASCLVKDPSKRPSAKKLLKHSFFRKARSNDYIARTILDGLPSLGDRMKTLKMKEEDMLAQKKMPDGKKEEISQNEYKRGLSGWNFDIEDLKAQASLIQDVEESLTDKEQGGSSCSSFGQGSFYSSFGVDMQDIQSEPLYQPSAIGQILKDIADIEDNDVIWNRPAHPQLADLTVQNSKAMCDASDDELSVCCVAGSSCEQNISQNGLLHLDDHIFNVVIEKHELEINGGLSEGMISHSSLQFGDSSGTNVLDLAFVKEESEKQQSQHQNMVSSDGIMVPHVVDDAPSESLSKASKASVGDDLDEKARAPVVQQRGRFKVTSENVDLEKVPPSPMLQKSHSMQVITQLPVLGQLPSFAARSSNPPGNSFYLQLHCLLQTNIQQRESILSLMKQTSSGDYTGNCDGGYVPTTTLTEKSLLEAAHDREKELLQEVTELQRRLMCAQDELQKLKTRNAQGKGHENFLQDEDESKEVDN
ncbi:STE20-like serine/threonine-protein kinase isoform X2 [Telopea speciosissima]|uniref:STE20-like serine/threonine-protein kinase isoform X2 n=1 Tax=Telopea speciosissima TaxID=54955 RepID=UPI001CC43C85|nr:STE20-like serine/threonine-protein kinase isoform X2 [Telopea speciosissima]